MGFQSATLQFSRNGDTAVARWRQDLAINDVVTVSLTDNVGVNSRIWRLIGRPEGSAAGGPRPEPRYLGTAQVASFTVDTLGTYIIQCLVNGGAPDALAISGGVAILESFLAPGNRPLRLLGPGESNEDIYDPMVVQGWIKMLNRWLTKIRAGGGTTDTFKVMSDEYDDDPDYLIGKVESTDGSVVITDDVAGKRVNFAVPTKPVPALTKRYYLSKVVSDNSGHTLLSTTQPAADVLQSASGRLGPLFFDSPIGEPDLLDWPSGVVTAVIRCRVLNPQSGVVYRLDGASEVDSETYTVLGREVVNNQGESGLKYETAPWPGVLSPALTSTLQSFTVPFAVTQQGWPLLASDRLLVSLRALIDTSDPNYHGQQLENEIFEISIGDSYLDTLFGDSGGGTADHQALYNRGTFLDPANSPLLAHPMSMIEPGWLQTPTTGVAVVGGLLPLASASPTPVTSNTVNVTGTGPLVGIEMTGKNDGDALELFFLGGAMTITNQGAPGNAAYGAVAFGTLGQGYPQPDVAINQYGILRLSLCGGVWRPVAPWFSPETT